MLPRDAGLGHSATRASAVDQDNDRPALESDSRASDNCEADERSNGAPSLERRFFNLKTAASFVVAFVIMYLAFSRVNVDPKLVVEHIREANIGVYFAAFVVYYLSFPLRAWRWKLLLSNVGYGRASEKALPSVRGLSMIIFVSWFANCIVPAKLGDAYRGYRLRQRSGVSFSRTMGTVFAERMIDMLVLIVLMGLAGSRLFGGHLPGIVRYLYVAGFLLALILLLTLLLMKKWGRQLEQRLPKRTQSVYVRFEEGTLQSFRNMPLLLVLTLSIWLIEAGRLWLILGSLGLTDVSLVVVIFTALAASLLTTLPVTPAGLGLVESSMVAILLFLNSLGVVHGLTESLAGSVAILDRTISYWSLVVIGLAVYLITRRK